MSLRNDLANVLAFIHIRAKEDDPIADALDLEQLQAAALFTPGAPRPGGMTIVLAEEALAHARTLRCPQGGAAVRTVMGLTQAAARHRPTAPSQEAITKGHQLLHRLIGYLTQDFHRGIL